jgi:hypothetical protein
MVITGGWFMALFCPQCDSCCGALSCVEKLPARGEKGGRGFFRLLQDLQPG